jgi:hypothetical protein
LKKVIDCLLSSRQGEILTSRLPKVLLLNIQGFFGGAKQSKGIHLIQS